MKKGILILLLATVASWSHAQFSIREGKTVKVAVSPSESPVVHTALELLERDLHAVLSAQLVKDERTGTLLIGTVTEKAGPLAEVTDVDFSCLQGREQAFLLNVLADGRLLIAGSDSHGTAYGIMELSRLLGVSPWEWWADATPARKKRFTLPDGYRDTQSPAVEYRGIFINDEDWGLTPWAGQTYEPTTVEGEIGPRSYARVFELLLRLRANTCWPAMHECTRPFFLTPGNRETAARYGIYIGGSHCEPMACSTAGEWPVRGKGKYDFVHNRTEVMKFWEDRVKEVSDQEIIYTIGIRGVHDGPMNGAKSASERMRATQQVLEAQRQLLAKHVDKDVTRIPQVFVPYKEVLSIYQEGLQVPDDVTLMWCDDNYGYIRHFPTPEERTRQGGNGVYYHVSYWGRPHDYLWLGTFSPGLLCQQMTLAYDRGIRKMWILNVGDIKPAEYQTELFMDLAWNGAEAMKKQGVNKHLHDFLQREFDGLADKGLASAMQEHYRLAYIRKPEFMGNTRVEEKQDPTSQVVKDLPWSEQEIVERLNDYDRLEKEVLRLEKKVSKEKKDAYFELVKYPVLSARLMNRKCLLAQLARHGKASWEESDAAFDSIVTLTEHYNALQGGKWNRIMDFQPRKLPVFDRIPHTVAQNALPNPRKTICAPDITQPDSGKVVLHEGMGYQNRVAGISQNNVVAFDFDCGQQDSIEVEIRLLPNHPIEGDRLRIELSLDGKETIVLSYATQGRSMEWKENVLRNQAIRRAKFPIDSRTAKHRLTLKALDEGVVLDQLLIY